MAYSAPITKSTGDLVSAADWNTNTSDNILAIALTTKGQLLTSDGTDPTKLGVGANNLFLLPASGETNGLKWGPIPSIWIGAGSFVSRFGSPANTELTGVGGTVNQGIPAWGLDADAAAEIVGANILVPTGVTTTTIDFVFAMLTATSGNILAGFITNAFAPGESANNESGGASPNLVVIAVPGTALEIKSQTITPDITISAGDILGINARRTGSDGTDTATGDCLFLGAKVNFS